MRSRPARALLAIAIAGLVFGVSACTGTPGDDDAPTVAELAKATPSTVDVADQGDRAARAIATSRALFHRAPGAVIAPADDAAAQERAARLATKEHVPALVTASTKHADDDGTGDDGSGDDDTGHDAAGHDAVGTELDRLGAGWYVAEGDVDVTTTARRTDPDDVGDEPAPHRASRPTTVVVADASDDRMAAATAEAAGAHVVRMPAGETDPAAAPDVLKELAARKDAPTLLLGKAFDALQHPEWTVRSAESGYQLAHGGQRPFDGHRYVALYGAPGAPSLGVLGEQGPAETVERAEAKAAEYDDVSATPVTPTLEIIGTMASGAAGDDGDYSTEIDPAKLEPYIDAAHEAHMPVIIDLQPGRADFLSQAKRYESLLSRPDVWLALDPEWRLGPDQVPLEQIGSVSASEVNAVSDWLAGLVRSKDLPPKALVLHQFRLSMLQDRTAIDTSHPELDVLIHGDGQGSQPDKQATWKALHVDAPAHVHWGWKNFIDEDQPMLTPAETMDQVQPSPSLITYQ